jgi:methionine salvage enolase-phosphatase E1
VVLDIEGTTSPISFVTDVLFPYARDNVRKHLDATYGTHETNDDIALLRAQVRLPVPRHSGLLLLNCSQQPMPNELRVASF